MSSIRSFFQDPPFRAELVDRTNKITPSWHLWCNFIAGRVGKVTLVAVDAVDPGSLVAGASQSATVPIPGVMPGDFAVASFDQMAAGISLTAASTAADTVVVWFTNLSGGTIDLPAGTLRVRVEKP